MTKAWTLIDRGALLHAALICSDYPNRDATIVDQAIAAAATEAGCDVAKIATIDRHVVVPFSSEAKRMAVVASLPEGQTLV